jgi:hypothetical protein
MSSNTKSPSQVQWTPENIKQAKRAVAAGGSAPQLLKKLSTKIGVLVSPRALDNIARRRFDPLYKRRPNLRAELRKMSLTIPLSKVRTDKNKPSSKHVHETPQPKPQPIHSPHRVYAKTHDLKTVRSTRTSWTKAPDPIIAWVLDGYKNGWLSDTTEAAAFLRQGGIGS